MPFEKPRSGARLRRPCAFLTGKERDSESNNDYFGARYYFAGNARWLSVDPLPGETNPQRLNRYTYVLNDPINMIDPNGADGMWISYWQPYWAEGVKLRWELVWKYFEIAPPAPNTRLGAYGGEVSGVGPRYAYPPPTSVANQGAFSQQYLLRVLPLTIKRPECADMFEGLGISYSDFIKKLEAAVFVDGTTTRDSYNRMFNPNPNARAGRNDISISRYFAAHPEVQALSASRYDQIYFRPGVATPETVAHEIFHKMKNSDGTNYLFDEDIMDFLSNWSPYTSPDFNPLGASEEISKEFKRRCLE